jgi:hypothetical protein
MPGTPTATGIGYGEDLSGARARPGPAERRRPRRGLGSDLSAVDPRTVDLAGAQVDVTQAVVLVTTSGLDVRPDAPG